MSALLALGLLHYGFVATGPAHVDGAISHAAPIQIEWHEHGEVVHAHLGSLESRAKSGDGGVHDHAHPRGALTHTHSVAPFVVMTGNIDAPFASLVMVLRWFAANDGLAPRASTPPLRPPRLSF